MAWHISKQNGGVQSKHRKHVKGQQTHIRQRLNMLQNIQKDSEMKPNVSAHTCYHIEPKVKVKEGQRGEGCPSPIQDFKPPSHH